MLGGAGAGKATLFPAGRGVIAALAPDQLPQVATTGEAFGG
jgi:hypothetical protein